MGFNELDVERFAAAGRRLLENASNSDLGDDARLTTVFVIGVVTHSDEEGEYELPYTYCESSSPFLQLGLIRAVQIQKEERAEGREE